MKYLFVALLFFSIILIWNRKAVATVDDVDQNGISTEKYAQVIREKNAKVIRSMFDFFNSEPVREPNSTQPTIPPENITYTPTPTIDITTQNPPPNQSFRALHDLYSAVSVRTFVPVCVLETISQIEWGRQWNYSPGQILQYSSPNQEIIYCHENFELPPHRGSWNSWSAIGPMQMTIGENVFGGNNCHGISCPNAWGSFGQAVRKYENVTWTPNVCNLRDAAYGAAEKLNTNKKGFQRANGRQPTDTLNWAPDEIIYAGARYFGSSTQKLEHQEKKPDGTYYTYGEYLLYKCSLQ